MPPVRLCCCCLMMLMAVEGLSPGKGVRLPANAPGNLYVDATCIDCDTCRWMAPEIFGRASDQSFVASQPMTEAARTSAAAAAVACPTGSIVTDTPSAEARDAVKSFPAAIIPGVYHLGFHSPKSFGATSYLVANGKDKPIMVDSPRYSSKLAQRIEQEFGEPEWLLLTHIDDVGDHNKWKKRFPGMLRAMHSLEITPPTQWPYIETKDIEHQFPKGDTRWPITAGVDAIFTPGHSPGSCCFLVSAERTGGDPVVFTGDHLTLSARLARLNGMGRYGWDLGLQAKSIRALADEEFLHVLPGHGRRVNFRDAQERRTAIEKAALDFEDDPYGKKQQRTPLYLTETQA